MNDHDQSAHSNVICTPWKADQNNSGHVVDDLLLEILQKIEQTNFT